MRLTLSSEHHFVRGADGRVYTDSLYPYAFWTRFHAEFDHVHVVARVRETSPGPDVLPADGPGVEFVALPDFTGPAGLARLAPAVTRKILAATAGQPAAILRIPGMIASLMWAALRVRRTPYGAQLVGDPDEGMRSDALRRFRRATMALTQRQTRGACALTYVTQRSLQERYPPPDVPVLVVSDVDLADALFTAPPIPVRDAPTLRAVFVGALEMPYKGLDVLLTALTLARTPIELTVIGEGRLRSEYAAQAERDGLGTRVHFRGRLPSSAAVIEELRHHDLFVLPSRSEGMPRALLEAMAVGLPAIASAVGGVPELLDSEFLVRPDDAQALAGKLDEMTPEHRRRAIAVQRQQAWSYRKSERDLRLTSFYRAVRAAAAP